MSVAQHSTKKGGRKGAGRLLGMWALALLCAAALFFVHEGWLRLRGIPPQVQDGKKLWSYTYSQALQARGKNNLNHKNKANHKHICVLVGGSRLRDGISAKAFHTAIERANAARSWSEHDTQNKSINKTYNLVQLSMGASTGYPVLKALAENENFRGTIIYSLHAGRTFPAASNNNAWQSEFFNRQQTYLNYYANTWQANPFVRLKFYLEHAANQRFAVRANKAYSPVHVLRTRILPATPALHIYPGRTRAHNYRSLPAETLQRYRGNNLRFMQRSHALAGEAPATPEAFARTLGAYFKPLVQQIQSRGGQVVFVRMPTSGKLRAYEAQHFPRQAYWNRVSELTGAPSIHFEDIAQLTAHAVPDGSHVCASAQPFFTSALVSKALQLGAL